MDGGREPAFYCRRCGNCCFGRGGVRLEAEELEPIARALGLAPADFLRLYLAEGPPPLGYSNRSGRFLFVSPAGRTVPPAGGQARHLPPLAFSAWITEMGKRLAGGPPGLSRLGRGDWLGRF